MAQLNEITYDPISLAHLLVFQRNIFDLFRIYYNLILILELIISYKN
jgi:hypothetical protein